MIGYLRGTLNTPGILAEKGLIPVAKMGAIYEARKSRLVEHQQQLEDATMARGNLDPEAA